MYEKAFLPPNVDFGAVRDGRRPPFFHYDLDLSTARSLAAGTAEVVELAGDSFYSDIDPVNQGDAVVIFQDTNLSANGAPVYVTRGHIVEAPFTRLLIENAAQPGKRLRFFYGVGIDFKPGAASTVNVSGSVRVIDQAEEITAADLAYSFRTAIAAVVGQFSAIQLWNPAGSGRELVVEEFGAVVTAPAGLLYGSNAVQLPTAATTPVNKYLGNPADANAQTYIGTNAAAQIAAADQLGFFASGDFRILPTPIIIPPGRGFIVMGDSTNVTLSGSIAYKVKV